MSDSLSKLDHAAKEKAAQTENAAPASAATAPAMEPAARSSQAKNTTLKNRTLSEISDQVLTDFLTEIPADDHAWVFYALVAEAANRREGTAVMHIRGLLNGGTIEGFVEKHLTKEIATMRGEVGAGLKKVNDSILELKAIEDEKSIESLSQFVARKVKADVVSAVNELAGNLDSRVDRLAKMQKEASNDIGHMSQRISDTVADQVGRKLGNNNILLVGACSVLALAFGLMAGISFTSGYTKSEIQGIVQATAAETAEQMRAAPPGPGQATRRQ